LAIRTLRRITLTDVLEEWGRHEAQGRISGDPKSGAMFSDLLTLVGSDGAESRMAAIETILWVRCSVVAGILAATPVDCLRVAIDAGDQDRILVMSRHDQPELALAARTDELLRVVNPDGDHVRRLASAAENIDPPLLAVARADLAKLTLLDGVHRGAAWVAHQRAGRFYEVEVNVVVTASPSFFEGKAA
jgi:hypothetical protein